MNVARYVSLLLAAVLLAACNVAAADDEIDTSDAMEGSREWLALVDGGRFAESWDAASPTFRNAIERDKWELTAVKARTGVGPLISRKLRTAQHTRHLANAPEGEYVVIQYDVRFERGPLASETVTIEKDKDGRWKVSGYWLR